MKTMMLVTALFALTTSAALAGCGAATPVPADKLARAQEAVRQADELPATANDPNALTHLQLAKNQLQYAKRLMIDGHNEDAKWVLMRAEADASAARDLAQAQAAKSDAQQTIDAIRAAMSMMGPAAEKGEGSGS